MKTLLTSIALLIIGGSTMLNAQGSRQPDLPVFTVDELFSGLRVALPAERARQVVTDLFGSETLARDAYLSADVLLLMSVVSDSLRQKVERYRDVLRSIDTQLVDSDPSWNDKRHRLLEAIRLGMPAIPDPP